MGATASMAIPMLAGDGVRQTVNAYLSSAQTIWNLRSALNVAALNCQDLKHTGMVENYGAFLKRNDRQLSTTNRTLTAEFKDKYGKTYRDEQDTYMTQVYNYFALPPAMDNFCDVSFAVGQESLLVEPKDLESFAARSLPRIESVFEDFFRAYEQYRVNLAAWNSQYGPPTTTTLVAGYNAPQTPAVILQPGANAAPPVNVAQPAIGSQPSANSPTTTVGQQPVAIPPANGLALPTQGPIFASGEVVQGEATAPAATAPAPVAAPSGASPSQTPIFASGEVVQGEEPAPETTPAETGANQTPVFQSGEVVQPIESGADPK